MGRLQGGTHIPYSHPNHINGFGIPISRIRRKYKSEYKPHGWKSKEFFFKANHAAARINLIYSFSREHINVQLDASP
jgi:hypothetical protein